MQFINTSSYSFLVK